VTTSAHNPNPGQKSAGRGSQARKGALKPPSKRFRLPEGAKAVQWKVDTGVWFVKTDKRVKDRVPMATYHAPGGTLLWLQYRTDRRLKGVEVLP
jgi:hypothetical protein